MISLLLTTSLVWAYDTKIYYNSSYHGSSDFTALENAITDAGGTVTFSSSTSWPSSSSSVSGYKLLIFITPGASFSSTQAGVLEDFVADGGRVVFVGDYELSLYGTCYLGFCDENSYINSALSKMGSDMELGESPVSYTGCDGAADISSDQLGDGVSEIKINASNTVANGVSVADYSGSTVVAVDQPSSVTHVRTPWDIVVVGDVEAMLSYSQGGCSGATTAGNNKTFWYNLYDGTVCHDDDGDGQTNETCGGTDCDDTDPDVYAGADEVCNGVDDDCDGTADNSAVDATTYYKDADADTYGDATSTSAACSKPSGYVSNGSDCDDGDAAIHPGAPEVCDDVDNDCDSSVDESSATDALTWYRDYDGDTYGNPSVTAKACDKPTGYVSNDDDCNDVAAGISPAASEVCDHVDNDCDGSIDESSATDVGTWYQDADGDTYGNFTVSTRSCDAPSGYVADYTDCNDGSAAVHPGATETCNSVDDDCDGSTDESDATDALTWYHDADGDTYGALADTARGCTTPSGYVADSTDCDDTRGATHPGADEYCNSIDDDCDGAVDESGVDAGTWYTDADGDTYGDVSTAVTTCARPSGSVTDDRDCDDADASIYPGATEHCDDADEDCDGVVDNDAVDVLDWYLDADADTFGDATTLATACDQPDGYADDPDDCDDADATIYPGATEVAYDGVDQDCVDGDWDDLDEDGHVGELAGGDDCDDSDAATFPGASEAADGADDDCDGVVDDGTDDYDDDGDGFTEAGGDCDDVDPDVNPAEMETADLVDEDCDGVTDEGTARYDDDGDGMTELDGDCNDDDPNVGAGMTEILDNGIDDDCDGKVDDGVTDTDGDGYTVEAGDCAPDDAAVKPGATELPNGVDDDCDGFVDEGTTAYDDDGDGMTEAGGDCDDNDVKTYDGATEAADGRDNDCDGVVDEGQDYTDDDGDGYSEDAGDCDDGATDVYPGAEEVLDGVDNDCDGDADETGGDADGDGYTVDDGDCDDQNGWANPGLDEVCDGEDNDCDQQIDEGCDAAVEPGGEDTGKGGEDGGCNCSTSGAATPAFGVLLAVLGLVRRRRR